MTGRRYCDMQMISFFEHSDKAGTVYHNYGLSYRSITARVARDVMTISKIWNRWVQDGNTERRARSQRPSITSSGEDRHVTHMALMERAAT
ncbi:HTH_Tnp_Tc3_2 domain-containing protein [Trichonephila clavipes]|uniref:HTH_Tnp_Tc3_2 domain-containing protein n=1 Tax=Trichonephila clavipes TaxID=2585209 RepID=A0A8X6SK47_TRICX|nr:HTH_Tnp_Tc3_2 domain-containing protein [Trichonephila clavipes]